MSQTFPQARRIASSPIGKPVAFVTGQFAGHTLRAELEELQKADLGRKYARKDRRPLDPPPVVQFRLFEVFNHGTPRETESEFDNYDEVTNLGILCHVDLFPITEDTDDADELSGGGTVQNTTPVSYIDSTSSATSRTLDSTYGRSPAPTYTVPSLLPSSLSSFTGSIPDPIPSHGGSAYSELYPSYPPSMAPSSAGLSAGLPQSTSPLSAPHPPFSPTLHPFSAPASAPHQAMSDSLSAPAYVPTTSTEMFPFPAFAATSWASEMFSTLSHAPLPTMPQLPTPSPSSSGQDFSMSAFPPSSTSLQMLSSPASPNMSQSYALSQGYPLSVILPSLPIPASRPLFDHTNSYPVQSASIGGEADTDIVAYYGDHPIRESSKCTHALAGTTFVQSASLEYNGKKVLMFVFSAAYQSLTFVQDLAVKIEGTFVLRYRVFNISSNAFVGSGIPILAECYGGPFKIYSTKEFPGLRASTDLTKHISFHGVRLNLRENERKRRKKNEIEAERRAAAAAADDNMSEADSSPAALSPVSCEPSTSAARTTGIRRSKRNKRQNRDKGRNSEDDSGDFDA